MDGGGGITDSPQGSCKLLEKVEVGEELGQIVGQFRVRANSRPIRGLPGLDSFQIRGQELIERRVRGRVKA